MDSLTLVDGGLVSNIPVNVALDMGADYVIAVNTTSDLRNVEELELPWNVADQTVSIPMKRLEKAELLKANFHLQPNIDNWSSTDFTNLDSLMLTGYNYTKSVLPIIQAQIDSLTRAKSEVEHYWIKNIKSAPNQNDFEKPYLQKYSLMDSVSSIEIFEDLSELYMTGGFDSLSATIEQDGDSTMVSFKYTLNPIIKELEIISNGTIDSAEADFLFRSLKDKPFYGRTIFDAVRSVIANHKKQGYVLFELNGYNFDAESGILSLDFNAGTISKININSETSKTVINRELNIKQGDRLLYSDLEDGLMRLKATGLFEDINLSVENDASGATINLDVNEKISSLMKIGFLVNEAYNAQLAVDIRDVNLFYSGTELGLFLFGGASNRAYILEHISYRILDTYFTYKLSAYYKFNDIDVYTQTNSETGNTFSSNYIGKYRQIFYGGALSIGTQLEKFGKLIFTGKYQYDEIKNKEGSVVSPYETKIVSLKIGGIVDNQNKYPYPENGVYFNGFYETAQSFLRRR